MNVLRSMEFEPDPREWLEKKKWPDVLEKQLKPSLNLIDSSGCLDQILATWIRCGVEDDARQYNVSNAGDVSNDDSQNFLLPLLRSYWLNKSESLFLKWQRLLDIVTCNYIILDDKYFSLELYHQIKANEITFPKAIEKYGRHKNDKQKFGTLIDAPLSRLPYGLEKVIKTMTPGQTFTPLRIKNEFCIVQLLDLKRASLNEVTKDRLMFMALDEWSNVVINAAKNTL